MISKKRCPSDFPTDLRLVQSNLLSDKACHHIMYFGCMTRVLRSPEKLRGVLQIRCHM